MIEFRRFKAVTFDCYGTLIDWESGIGNLVVPWLRDMHTQVPVDLVVSAFALMQAKHQQIRPALPYPDVLRSAWRDIEGTFGWEESVARRDAFAASIGDWPPFPDTVDALRHLAQFYKLAILSNVDNASLSQTLKQLTVPFAFSVTAENVGSYKPALPHFNAAIGKLAGLGIGLGEILHVAQSKHHDINPGRQLGLTTVWINRRHGKRGSGATLAAEAKPHLAVTSLAELVSLHKKSLEFEIFSRADRSPTRQ